MTWVGIGLEMNPYSNVEGPAVRQCTVVTKYINVCIIGDGGPVGAVSSRLLSCIHKVYTQGLQ